MKAEISETLCFSWIDGVRNSIDAESYKIRFTPRKKTSIWSAVNIKKIEVFTTQGLMTAAGLESYNHRTESKSKVYSFEKDEVQLSSAREKIFKENNTGWDYFLSLAGTYSLEFFQNGFWQRRQFVKTD